MDWAKFFTVLHNPMLSCKSPGKRNMAEMAKEDEKMLPLVIFYDSEAANGDVYCGDIIEIAAKCLVDGVKGSFQTLINTKQPLCAFGECFCLN